MTETERVEKIFDRYAEAMRTRSLQWTFRGNGRWAERRINKFLKYFFIPVDISEVIGFLDTTSLRTGKEGFLVTASGIFVKEVINKLYYLEYEKIERAEVLEEIDEGYNISTSLWIHFKDGTKRQIFDYYLNKNSFAEYINEIVCPDKAKEIAYVLNEE